MRAVLRLAPALLLFAACSDQQPVQVQEATAVEPPAPPPEPEPPPGPALLELADGLVVDVLEYGRGPAARRGGRVLVHYTARVDGAEAPFDSSWSRGVPDRWLLTTRGTPRLVEGLVRGLDGLPAGTRCIVRIPSPLGFGEQGNPAAGIPADAALVYEVLLLESGD
jgi:peptidylprolyl isomerase